jgi:hypothetical protein
MKTVWQPSVREELKSRLAKLDEHQTPGWGKMTAGRMVVHIADTFRTSIGELTIKPNALPFRYLPIKQLFIYWLPFAKNLPTAPELIARHPGEWTADVRELAGLVDRFATRDRAGAWPDHTLFGSMTGDDWGVLMYRHTDHHFRQFGI